MKRLLCIVGSMNAGGAETFLMKIYRQLDKTKYQMDFAVATEKEGFYDKEILQMGGKIFHITPKSVSAVKNFNSIRDIVRDNRYNYVLRTSQHSLSALELLAAKLGGAKVRVFRSSNSNTTTGSKKELTLHKICKFMPRAFANVRIAPSTEAAEFMFGKGCIQNYKAFLLHNAIDTNIYQYSTEARNRIRKELGIESEFVIGHVGRFNQQKNHKFLIEIFVQILQKKPNSKLVLTGVGELEDKIKQQVYEYHIEDKVIFTGVRKDIPQLLSAFDVFLFPSLYEGMPNTVIEAQTTGLSCVIADTITKEAVITNIVYQVSLQESVQSWADKVLQVGQSKRMDKSKEMKEKGYDIIAVTEEFIKLVFWK
jgi:glycosyltransferase involved in cell wall biosynthesis